MEEVRSHPSESAAHTVRRARTSRTVATTAVVVLTAALAMGGCAFAATPDSATLPGLSPPSGWPLGYVVCPSALTPVELVTRTAEAPIALPVSGTPTLGDYAVTTAPDGEWAYVLTQSATAAGTTDDVVIPVNLTTQRAGRPIVLPGHGATHAIVMTHDGRTVLAASGTTIVPVDPATRAVGTPLNLGAGRTIFGMALDPTTPTLYALVPGGLVTVDTATGTLGSAILTGLAVSSVTSPHGVVVSADGTTVYVVGQGGSDYGGRLVPIAAASGTVGVPTSFDQFGITDPAAVALTGSGSTVLVADSADNWVVSVPVGRLATPSTPARLPTGAASSAGTGTDHPSDIVVGPGSTGAFVVTGLDTVLPFDPSTGTFGRAIRVCSGASSMAVASP